MADPTTDQTGVTALLAPWMAQNPWDMSNYGGQGQFGAQMLAASGPTLYRQPFLAALGKGMLAGQKDALENAQSRMGIATNSLALQRQMALWPLIAAAMRRMGGQGGAAPVPNGTTPVPVPNGAPAPSAQDASASSPNASPAAGGSSPAPSAPQGGGAPAAPAQAQAAPPWMGGNDGMSPQDESRLGAMFSLAGMKNDLGTDAAFQAANNPGWQTQLAFAKSPEAQDMMLLNAAARSNNQQLAQMAMTHLRSLMGVEHIGSMSGIRTYQEADGSWTTVNPSNGLRVNDRTGASYMPGALNAFAAREAAEQGARTRAELTTETAPASGSSGGAGGAGGGTPAAPGPVSARPGRALAQPVAPQGQLTGLAAIQSPNFVPPILTAAGNVPQAPGSTSLVALKAAQEGQAKEAGEWVGEQNQKASEGQVLMAQTSQIRASAAEYPWTGRFADDRATYLNILQGAGWLSPQQVKELSAYQDASKISIQLQASATRQLGSREAAQVFGVMGKSIPNLTLSPDGLDKVGAYMEGVARYNQAMALYGQRLMAQGNVAAVNQVENTFIAHTNPAYFIMASASPKTRAEFLATMTPARRNAFLQNWDAAIKDGLAPRPLDYQAQGQ